MEHEINAVLREVEKALALHMGGVELVSFTKETGEVAVRLLGTCAQCGLAGVTLKEGIEASLVRALPYVKRVRAVQ